MGRLATAWGRRIAAAVALTATFWAIAPTAASARRVGRAATRVCDYDWQRSRHQVKLMIRCAARHWHVAGGPDKAIRVARCESRFDPDAYNPAGYLGVFQQARRYWPDRAGRFGFDGRSAFNGRANVIVSIRMAHAGGWAPWSCA